MDPEQSYIHPIPCKNKEVYAELNTLVFEYLEVNGLEQALHTFSKECQAKNLPCPRLGPGRDVKAAFTHYDGEHLLKSFDEGELETFLKLWKQFQNHIQVTSEDMKKLEVYLRVHFAIYPKATSQSEAKQNQAMQSLKGYFEEHSATLSSDATILPLFALPFVPDPRPHPIFKDLFHESWTAKLRAQLETTVNKYFELLQENITTHCKLASVVSKHVKSPALPISQSGKSPVGSAGKKSNSSFRSATNARGSTPPNQAKTGSTTKIGDGGKAVTKLSSESAAYYHQERFFQLMGVHRRTRRVLRGIKESYGKLLRVTAELIKALEQSVDSNEPAKLDLVLPQCFTIFPEIFTNMEIPGSQPNLEHFKKIAKSSYLFEEPPDSDVSLMFHGIQGIGPDALNYEKIKVDLMSDTVNQTVKLCVMQALRWMVTKTSSDSRSQVMASYLEHDILGIQSKKPDLRHKLFSCMLSPNPTYLKESLSRFVNALACLCGGRKYLTSTDYVIDILIKSLSTFKSQEESFICHMVVATLQKLSLRKTMRLTMIEQNVIPWIVKYIKTELDRDIIRDEVSQIAMECVRDSNIELTKPQTVAMGSNNGSSNGSKSDFYGDSFNNYLMEYAWALLMNLCLHDESIPSAQSVDYDFLHCIVTMLTNKSSLEFIPYVISTLFSLLRNPEMFEKAKAMKLNQQLAPLVVQQTGEISTHLRHMLNQLYGNDGADRLMETSGETDYDDTDFPDPEEVESELELYESWMGNQNETRLLTGDDLLIREYLANKDALPPPSPLSETEGQKKPKTPTQENSSDSVDDSGKVGGLLFRPTTPTRSVPKNLRATNLTNFSRPTTPGSRLVSKTRQEMSSKSNSPKGIAESGQPLHTPKELIQLVNQANGQSKKPVCQTKPTQIGLLHPEPSLNPLVHPEPYQKPRQQLSTGTNATKSNNTITNKLDHIPHGHTIDLPSTLQTELSTEEDSTVAVYQTNLTSATNTMNNSITSCFNEGGIGPAETQNWGHQNDDLPAILIRQKTANKNNQ
ncbi:LisH domain-containing protein ARMC9 [Orchesella cincta]|uniref:LisH domain-containing protein ARMC9 n=1 Tax=Orchesella cincta TaxID=48709 RepID=A0A1D2MQ32_ORCCI|nr:LisH domain-containing protein ARMC9 [Orchesella cincta]